MKKQNLLSILFLFFGLLIYAQKTESTTTEENWSTPQGVFDQVFDGDGNSFKITDILAGKTYTASTPPSISVKLCTVGIFELYFETGCGMEDTTIPLHNQRRDIVCQAFQDVSDFINTPLKNTGNLTKVKIWIRNQTNVGITISEKARGVTYHVVPFPSGSSPNLSGITDGEVWRTIHTGKDSYTNVVFPLMNTENPAGIYHGYLSFNFSNLAIIWNYTYSKYNAATGFPAGNTDFYTQTIHEITHMLGITSFENEYGGSSISFFSGSGTSIAPYYSRFDKFLKAYVTPTLLNPVITNTAATSGEMYTFTTQVFSQLYPGCAVSPPVSTNPNTDYSNCTTSLRYVGATTLPLYTPKCFEKRNSFSHFEDSCFGSLGNDNYFLLSNKENGVIAKRTLAPEERLVLNDIGYSVKGTFGITGNFTYRNYGVGDSAGITVGGVNDAFTTTGTYVYQGNTGAGITLTGFLNNDYCATPANIRFEFLQDMYDYYATFTATSGLTTTNVSFTTTVPGIHVLRYVPYDVVTNKRGNITYIIVNVLNNCAVNNPCSLVKNGDFEQYNILPNVNPNIFYSCGWQNGYYRGTADYFNTAFGGIFNNVPCNGFGYQVDRIAGNQAYAGAAFSTTGSENIKTELSAPLSANTQYQLKFDVSLAEGRSLRSIKFQTFITDTDLPLTFDGTIPTSEITANRIFLTNTTFSNAAAAAADGWQTITFNFTTSSNANLKYLYIGALNNFQMQNETGLSFSCPGTSGIAQGTSAYYYIDNVSIIKTSSVTLDAVNDDFTSASINTSTGGTTSSVYTNDLYNGCAINASSLSNVSFSLVTPLAIPGATINPQGQITIPINTLPGTYTLTYKLSLVTNAAVFDTATVTILVFGTPPLVFALRANNSVDKIGLQSNGKIIIMGNFTTYNNIAKPYIARLNTDLTLDTTFSVTGLMTSTLTPFSYDFVIQPDDKIILVGRNQEIGYSDGRSKGIVRLNANGSADPTFNIVSGANQGLTGGIDQYIRAVALQPDGKILIGSGAPNQFANQFTFNGVQVKNIFRLLPNGVLDNQSSNGGFVNYPYTFSSDNVQGFIDKIVYIKGATTSLDRILVSGPNSGTGSSSEQPNVFQLKLDGSLDSSFSVGRTGVNIFSSPYTSCYYCSAPVQKMLVQPDGKIIIVGSFNSYNGSLKTNVVRLSPTGAVDNTFLIIPNRAIKDIEYNPIDNSYFVSGEFTSVNSISKNRLIKIDANGNLINSFNIGSGTEHSILPSHNSVRSLKMQSDGKLIIGGYFDTYNQISATNITRIYPGIAGSQLKGSSLLYQSEPEIDFNFEDNLVIYPNPSKDIFNINLSQTSDLYDKIIVHNLLGEVLYEGTLISKENNQLNLTTLPSGYYIAKIFNSKNNIYKQFKLIKQ